MPKNGRGLATALLSHQVAGKSIGLDRNGNENVLAKAHESVTTNGRENTLVSEDWGFVTGMCPAMQALESVVAEIAPTNIPVLFVGDSGTGKAMFAQRLRRLSSRSEEPLLTIACAALNLAPPSTELRLAPSRNTEASVQTAGIAGNEEPGKDMAKRLLGELP